MNLERVPIRRNGTHSSQAVRLGELAAFFAPFITHAIDPGMNQVTGNPAQQFMPLGEALMLAERYRGEGRLMEAEALCRRVLEAQPNVPEAEHLLGVIAHQNGRLGDAIEHRRAALKRAPQ